MAAPKPPRPSFTFPPLPRWELAVHAAVITSMFAYIWFLRSPWIPLHNATALPGQLSPSAVPLLGRRRLRDIADFEWDSVYLAAPGWLVALAASSLLVHGAGKCCDPGSDREKWVVLCGSLLILSFLMVPWELGATLTQALLVFGLLSIAPYQGLLWASVGGLLWWNIRWVSWSEAGFLSFIFKQYSLFHYASFGASESCGPATLLDFLHYVFYIPYKGYVIMPARLFQQRWAERRLEDRRWANLAAKAARLVCWYYALEIVCHYCYLRPLAWNLWELPESVQESRMDMLSLQFALGLVFHLKYTVIWGLPNLALQVDRMQPLRAPTCVARVALYGRIWREFDRGLYLFIKHQIYLPICRPTFSPARKAAAAAIVFTVVLVWHDVRLNILVWVLINAAVLAIAGLAAAAFRRSPRLQRFCLDELSPTAFRRLLGILNIPLVIASVLGIGFFLGGPHLGAHTARLVLWEDWLGLWGWNVLGQAALAYSFAQFCIQVGVWVDARQRGEDEKWRRQREKIE